MARKLPDARVYEGNRLTTFVILVEFNQASDASREHWSGTTPHYRRYRQAFRLDAAHAAYHSEWFISAIRELVVCQEFVDDPAWIAGRLHRRISEREAACV